MQDRFPARRWGRGFSSAPLLRRSSYNARQTAMGVALRRLVLVGFGLALAWPRAAGQLQNGSFESASVDPGGGFVTLPLGSMHITGGTVVAGDIDYSGGDWMPADGTRSLDRVGDQNVGGLQQTFDTIPGATCQVSRPRRQAGRRR